MDGTHTKVFKRKKGSSHCARCIKAAAVRSEFIHRCSSRMEQNKTKARQSHVSGKESDIIL